MDFPNNNAALFSPSKIKCLILVWLLFGVTETMGMPNAEISDFAQSSCKTGPSNNYTQIMWNTHKCCNSCPPGTHMTKPCDPKDPSTTECSPCDPNTFTEHPNLLDECFPQYPCLEQFGQKTVKQGTATNNFECSCMDGYEETADGHCRRLRTPDKHQDKTTRFHDPPQDGGAISKPPIQPFTTPFTISLTERLLTDKKQPVLSSKVSTVAVDKNGFIKGTTTGPLFKPPETKATGGNDGSASITHIVIIVVPCTIAIVGIVAIVAIVIALASKRSRVQDYHKVHHKEHKDIENPHGTDGPHPDNDSTTSFISDSTDNGNHGKPALDAVSNSTALGVMECNLSASKTTLNNPRDNWEERLETEKPKCSTSLNDLGSAFQQLNNDNIPSSAVNN